MSLSKVDAEKIAHAAEVFKALGNHVRLRIVDILQKGPMRVKEIATELDCPQPIVSQQLKILRNLNVVERVRDNHTHRYRLTSKHYSDMIRCMKGCLGINNE